MIREYLVFEYSGQIRQNLYDRIVETYGRNYKITIEENVESDAYPDCNIKIFQVNDVINKEVVDDSKKRLDTGANKENEEWPKPVHS
jgi:hypothetical protein